MTWGPKKTEKIMARIDLAKCYLETHEDTGPCPDDTQRNLNKLKMYILASLGNPVLQLFQLSVHNFESIL